MSSGVDPESVDSEVQPECQGLLELGHDFGVVEVEVGLVRFELVQVILAALLVVGPG